jgi:hypothetical protein
MKGKVDPERRTQLIEEGKALKDRLAVIEAQVLEAEDALQREGQRLPNLTHPDVRARICQVCIRILADGTCNLASDMICSYASAVSLQSITLGILTYLNY